MKFWGQIDARLSPGAEPAPAPAELMRTLDWVDFPLPYDLSARYRLTPRDVQESGPTIRDTPRPDLLRVLVRIELPSDQTPSGVGGMHRAVMPHAHTAFPLALRASFTEMTGEAGGEWLCTENFSAGTRDHSRLHQFVHGASWLDAFTQGRDKCVSALSVLRDAMEARRRLLYESPGSELFLAWELRRMAGEADE